VGEESPVLLAGGVENLPVRSLLLVPLNEMDGIVAPIA